MKIRISGREYSFLRPNQASLTQLIILRRQSGLALDRVEAGAHTIQEIIAKAEKDDISQEEMALRVFSDEDALLTFAASIWLSRWQAGDGLDFEAANDFPLSELEFVPEPGDDLDEENAEPDPH